MAKNQFNPDYPSTVDEAIKMIKGHRREYKISCGWSGNYSDCQETFLVGLNYGLTVLTQLKKNMKKASK